MNTSTRFFFFFLILIIPSFFIVFREISDPSNSSILPYSIVFPLFFSLIIPFITLPLYSKKKNSSDNPSILFKVPKFASTYSKIGFISAGILGYVLSLVVIILQYSCFFGECFFVSFLYGFAGALGGFVFGAIIGGVIDLFKKQK